MILARNSITLHHLRDITTVVWYYKLQASTASPPAKPTTATPSGWSTTEPTYTEGSTNSLYVVQKTTFSDGTFEYSDVSLSTSYEAAKIAYNKAVVAQESADAIPATVPGINLSPFFSHDLTDIYDANTNPNGFWMDNGTSYGWTKNPKFTFTKLEDGWLHVHVDNSSGTGIIRNDCCVTRYNPSVKRATKYTFLAEFRNNQSTGAASGADFYLVQQSGSVQFWGQNVSTAPSEKLEGIGGLATRVIDIPSDGSYAFSRGTKYSEPDDSSHWTTNEKMVTFTFRANAGAVLDYDIRLSLYEGEYWGPYAPYVVSDISTARKVADNYLSADNTGIMVADMTDGTQYTPSNVPSGTKNTFINEDSFQVRDGSDVLASFGETTQIGQDGTNHQVIDSTGLQGINEDGVTVFRIDMDGAVAETFVSSGKRLAFLKNIAGGQSKTVTVPLDDFPMINKRVILKVVTLFRTDEGGIVEQHNSIERFTYGTDAQLSKTYGATQYTVTYSATDNTLTLLVQVGDAPARQYTYVELSLLSYYTSTPAPAFLFGSRYDSDNLGAFSGTIGEALSASTRDQFACGRYNYEDADYAFMVGNGDENGDSNAFAVTWDGNQLMALDEEATTGTDAELYAAITAHGWESEVIV